MMTDIIRFIIAAIFLVIGIVFGIISVLGVYRFKFVMNRMHSAAILDTVAVGFIFLGLMILGNVSYIPKLIIAVFLLWIGSPAASHIVSKMEVSTDESAKEHIEIVNDKESKGE